MDASFAATSLLLALLLFLHPHYHYLVWAAMDSCYDEEGAPSRCMPKFENIAFNHTVEVSNVCGSPPEDYCMQTGSTRSCHYCDASDPDLSHNASLLSDFHRNEEPTWWQSQSMYYGIQHPNSVNLTLHLGKAFEITYIRLKFYTSRPESFAIYKRTEEDGPWVPYQFYSASCRKTYGKDGKGYIRPGDDERTALCTDEFSDISPLTGGNVAFSTLEGRPSAYNFDQSVVLQEWVTATDLLISLDRLNTFGDEFFKDAKVLRSYFYAISDFSVGGRCKCNGHASECVEGEHGGLFCSCQHNTVGTDCQRCHPFYQDRPWARATGDSANECRSRASVTPAGVWTTALLWMAAAIVSEMWRDKAATDQDDWLGVFSGGQEYPLLWKEGEVYLLPLNNEDTGFYKAPEKFLGHQFYSYGQLLSITFTSETPELLPNHVTLLLQGSRVTLSAQLSSQPVLAHDSGLTPRRSFIVRLHEHEMRFRPRLSAFEFQYLLYNLTSIRISNAGGQNYTSQLTGVTLTSAVISSGSAHPPAPWVETCSCPPGFAGQYCEECAPGFTREVPGSGPLSSCVPCNCHQHGTCHPETGLCECSDFTAGTTCEYCLDGYYGNALMGTPGDCQPCPCPDRSSCAQIVATGQVVCTNCPAGQTGMRCQMCEDGYYGDPLGQSGTVRPCIKCNCNGNVDFNAVGICDRITGRCLKCLGHTEGDHCQHCQQGFYGNPLNQTAGQKCKPCSCNPAGTSGHVNDCHPQTGNCQCLDHVSGWDCSYCEVGFFNLQTGVGCERCQCNPVGSSSIACHPVTGQCVCHSGVEGRLCDSCRAGFFGFSSRGCRACNCDPMGSVSMQCQSNGTCHCRQGFVGYKCDKCELNYFHNRATHQCEECPVCYGLVKKQAEKLRTRLQDLEKLLAHFDCRGRFGKQHHLLKYHMARLYEHEHQREDTLPNALEDFLAFQEAREAFIKQFSLLEASTGTLLAQLYSITNSLNCSISMAEKEEKEKDEGSRGVCQTFTDTVSMIRASQKQLKQATLDLDNMIIPFEVVSGPNKWNIMVNDSQVLMKSHREMADDIEAIASRAVRASKQTFGFLMDLLQDNSTEEYIRNLTEQIAQMQQQKENLTAQVNDTVASQLALEEEAAELKLALSNITSSLHQLALTDAMPSPQPDQTQFNQTHSSNRTTKWGEELLKQTKELDRQIQAKDDVIGKISNKTETLKATTSKKMEMVEDVNELQARARGAKVVALSSVVTGKEVESEVVSLHKELENMVREWPRQQAQTKAAIKKERPLEEKVLADVGKKVSQIVQMLKPALENSPLYNITEQVEQTANAVAKESKAVLTQAKHTRTASAHLSSHIDSAVQLLAEQEMLSETANSQTAPEPELSLTNLKVDMEAAKLQLEAYSVTLTELITKIDGNVPLERFDLILNETARRLSMLRASVESPTLSSKIQKLHSAAKEQQSRLSLIEKDLQEIREERDSLRDIALNLPQSCPQASGAGNG
ncbi:hypothetical protein Q8A73_019547 [Channa argus]|nr:hypothetical protein Q8A73_019547 [Channa argus]